MTTEQKSDYWQQHIKHWHESNLSQKAYCNEQGLSFASFGYWRTRLNRKPVNSDKFIPANLSAAASVTVRLPVGLQLEFPAHLLPELLPVIVQSLEGRH